MIVFSVVLLVVGLLIHVPFLFFVGLVALVVGCGLALLGSTGHAVGRRRHYY